MWVMDIFLISVDMWGGARPPKVRGPRANGDLKKKKPRQRVNCFKAASSKVLVF